MIYELRTYTLRPGTQGEYLKLAGEVGRKIRGDNYGKLEGCWSTEFGTLNQLVYLWSFTDLGERGRLLAELGARSEWTKEYLPKTAPLIVSQETKILSAVLPFAPPSDGGNVYELRCYRTQVGKAGEWIEHFKGVMPVRETYSHRVGLWRTEIGQLNEVVHLWVYHDLVHRATVRGKLAQDPAWQAFIATATPLLAHMQSAVLIPTPFSPVK